jgi:hypothetical protein
MIEEDRDIVRFRASLARDSDSEGDGEQSYWGGEDADILQVVRIEVVRPGGHCSEGYVAGQGAKHESCDVGDSASWIISKGISLRDVLGEP